MNSTMIALEPFGEADFGRLISWVDDTASLIQFAGPTFQFPLTSEQLQTNLSDKNRLVFKVTHTATNDVIGHAEIYRTGDNTARLCRILIGNKSYRGQGLGEQLVRQLVNYAFDQLNVSTVDLNVYDWNAPAVACYEKVGFTLNPDKFYTVEVNGETWKAVNMVLDKTN